MADQKKLGASPAERKRITGERKSKAIKGAAFAKRKSNLTKGFGDLPAGSPIKGERDKDLARLKKMKEDAKKFELEVISKKKAQTSKLKDPLIERAKKSIAKYDKSKGGPKMGFTGKALSIKGASGPGGKKLKRMSSGGKIKTSSYYSSGGKVYTGR